MTQTTQLPRSSNARASSLGTASALAALLAVGACASTPPAPTESLQAAETAIADAERIRVADYASPELTEARAKLTAARDAVHAERMVTAQYLAEESRAAAELAAAKTEVVKAQAVNNDMQKSIDTLKQETQRKSKAAQ